MPHPIEPYAAQAYIEGWTRSGGPMTDRVRAGYVAALDFAVAHADHPGVLEATLKLGSLEGVWAQIYDRRQKLYDDSIVAVLDAWRALVASLDISALVRAVRHQAGLAEAKADQTTAQYAAALVLAQLQGLMIRGDWLTLRQAVQDALANGSAEGQASAMALLADRIGKAGSFDFDAAFNDAVAQFGALTPMAASVDAWLGQLLNLVSTQAGNAIAQSIADGDNPDDTEGDATDALSTPTRSVTHFVDYLVHLAITAGILWWYRSNGVPQVWFITAGDQLVCPMCDDAEANSPYELANAPQPPLHVNCRCSLYTDNELPASLVDAYL